MEPVYVRRLRSKTVGKPGPTLVELRDDSLRNPILVADKVLRSKTEYQSVYISPDRIEAERQQDFALRSERNKLNIRPLLEFDVPVWSTALKCDIDLLERVQHRATRLTP